MAAFALEKDFIEDYRKFKVVPTRLTYGEKHGAPLRGIKPSIGVVQQFLKHQLGLTEEQHRSLYKPMNQGIRRNGRPK